jgi:hypothetical protein
MSDADFSNKNLGVGGAIIISAWITHKDNGAMTSLNLANNNLGELVLPTGWTAHLTNDGKRTYYVTEGQPSQWEAPSGSTSEGAIALANAIPDMGALYSLDLSDNGLGAEGAKVLAKMLKKGSLFCKDGRCFTSKSMLAQATCCTHCGNKKSAHRNGALSVLNIARSQLNDQGAIALASGLAISRYAGLSVAILRHDLLYQPVLLHPTHSTLTKVDASDNALTDKGRKALQQAASNRYACPLRMDLILMLTLSFLLFDTRAFSTHAGSNSCSSAPAHTTGLPMRSVRVSTRA